MATLLIEVVKSGHWRQMHRDGEALRMSVPAEDADARAVVDQALRLLIESGETVVRARHYREVWALACTNPGGGVTVLFREPQS